MVKTSENLIKSPKNAFTRSMAILNVPETLLICISKGTISGMAATSGATIWSSF